VSLLSLFCSHEERRYDNMEYIPKALQVLLLKGSNTKISARRKYHRFLVVIFLSGGEHANCFACVGDSNSGAMFWCYPAPKQASCDQRSCERERTRKSGSNPFLQKLSTHWYFCIISFTKILNESCESLPDFLTSSARRKYHRFLVVIFLSGGEHANCFACVGDSNSGAMFWCYPAPKQASCDQRSCERERTRKSGSNPPSSAVSFIYRETRWLIFKAIGSDTRNQQKARTLWGSSFLFLAR
jgi:uncharacterized Fe-S cluster-containing radical SAM superfamily protein